MIRTHRRINIAQAYKLADKEWVTIEALRSAGAYGTNFSIHRAFRRMLEHEAAIIKPRSGGTEYRVTRRGMSLLGLIPTKVDHHERDHPD